MVPKGWSSSQLGEIMSFKNGLNFTKTDNGDSVKIVGVGDFKDLSELSSTEHLELISVAGRIRDEELLNNGDLLFVRSNGNKDLIGRCMFFPEVRERLSFSGFTIRGRVINESTLPAYMAIVARSSQFQMQISKASGGTNISNLSQQILNDINLLLPPLIEQKKIAEILSTWDKAISVTEKLLANSQQQKKALMQQLLTGKKRLLDENGVRFSGEWEYTIFGNLGDTYTGLTGKTKEDFGAGKPYIPYINIFKNSRIDIQNLEYVQVNDDERQSVVKYGDIFFTTSSETPEEVGMSSVLLEEVSEVFLNSFCFGFRLNNFETLIPKYARYLFRSEHVRRQISTLGQGATRYNLSKRQLIKLELKLPCVEEQQKIAAVLSAADAEISTLEKKLACLRDEKKALMQQLLTGKRRVKVDEAVAE
ncbi:TPA: restriction endonuclease subunit S [Escherichia coli]|nr:restriction endonuclease subunit S [Escherichia coli]HBC1664107.1 restriction endonuclease subunit S [Escherichia coli]